MPDTQFYSGHHHPSNARRCTACGIPTALAHSQQHRRSSRTGRHRFLVLQYEGPPCPAAALHRLVAPPRLQAHKPPSARHESAARNRTSNSLQV